MGRLQQLHDVLQDMDKWGPVNFEFPFKGLTYDLTYNRCLGLPSNDSTLADGKETSDFIVTHPFDFNNWPKDAKTTVEDVQKGINPGETYLQKSFKAVLRKGIKLWMVENKGAGTKTSPEDLFIDIVMLKENRDAAWFIDGRKEGSTIDAKSPDESVAQAIATVLNDEAIVPRDTVRPVIRFLLGTDAQNIGQTPKFWQESMRPNFETIFWRHGENLVKHPLAAYHVGFYNPNFESPTQNTEKVEKVIDMFAYLAQQWLTKSSHDTVKQGLREIFHGSKMSPSWNHGKLLVVGGKTMMTGGINFWPQYTAKDRSNIIDMQAVVTGDAAVSAHGYANYFWNYFMQGHITDQNSFSFTTPMAIPASEIKWDSTQHKDIPIFTSKTPLRSSSEQGAVPVLCTSRLGDWHKALPRLFSLDYPVQIVDLLRDVGINISFPPVPAVIDDKVDRTPFHHFIDTLTEYSDERFKDIFTFWVGYSPAAWASRYARIWAIRNAKRNVRLSNQAIAGTLQAKNANFNTLKDQMNTFMRDAWHKTRDWDGALYPYDLLMAFANILYGIRNEPNPSDPPMDTDKGIFVVLAAHTTERKDPNMNDWLDPTPWKEIRDRVQLLLMAIDDKLSAAKCAEIVSKKLLLHRAAFTKTHDCDIVHAKTYCIDDELLYIGSDNLYPSYNEEHGIWVEDRKALTDWKTKYWDNLWRDTVHKDGAE